MFTRKTIQATLLLVWLMAGASALAAPVTDERLSALAEPERGAWQAYLVRSRAAAALDQAALDAELTANNLSAALPAPDGGDFKLPAKPGDPYYATEEAHNLAATVLSYQTPSGGWSKHTGYKAGPRKPGMLWSSQYAPGKSPHYLATFDNRSTTEQLIFLAAMNEASPDEAFQAAFVRGMNYILDAQYPNGGWPQVYPIEGGYHDDITLNDDAMTRILSLLQEIRAGEPRYAFLDPALRARAVHAYDSGIACLLKLQVSQHNRPTVWCAQFDAIELTPASARAMEPATLSGVESARVLEMLMRDPKPSPAVVVSIEAGLTWFESSKITGIARRTVDSTTTYVADPSSTEVYWARFYDLNTGKPVFPGRDGIVYSTYAEMAANNRVGYDYYTTRPGSLLNAGQKKWRKLIANH